MNWFENFEYLYGKRFGWKIAWANRKKGDSVEVGPGTEQVVEGKEPHGDHGLYVKEWAMAHPDTRHISFTYPPVASVWVVTLHYLFCTRIHPYPLIALLPIGSGYFRAKPFPVWIPQHFSNLVIIHLLDYEDVTECSETSAYKIQRPGNYPEERTQHSEHGESLE